MRFHRGEWIVYKLNEELRTGRCLEDSSCGVIVEDQDTAQHFLLPHHLVKAETDDIRQKREYLGYYAQDLASAQELFNGH